jgi:hypothetical protein
MLGSCTKLIAIYCGPFEILNRIGHVAYMLSFIGTIKIHNVFHVSLLETGMILRMEIYFKM